MTLLLLACTSRILLSGGEPADTAGGVDTEIEGVPDDTSGDRDTGEDTGSSSKIDVFDTSFVHKVEFTVSAEGVRALTLWPSPYASTTMAFDGEELPDVGIRVKGRYGSYRTMPGKVGLKVDLREFGSTQDLHGIEKFNLNNMVQDCAKVHEFAAYGAHRLLGLPAPRVAYAQVFINGEDYGLYSMVEEQDDEFLKDNFDDPTGNLYDGDYYLYPDWSSYILLDFNVDTQDLFVLDSGTDVGLADIAGVTEQVGRRGTFGDTVGQVVDEDQHAAFLALAAWTGHSDSYSYYSNNYRVYFDPGRGGRAVFLPWDPDWAFYRDTNVNGPYGVVSQRCFADDACRAKVRGYVDQLSDQIPGGALEDEVRAVVELISDPLALDPKRETTMGDVGYCQSDLFDWFSRRGGELDSWGF